MKNFIHAMDGFNTNNVYYTDTDSLYNENKHWDKLNHAGLVGKKLLQSQNDYKDGGIFYALFLAPKKILPNKKEIWCYRWTQELQKIFKCIW